MIDVLEPSAMPAENTAPPPPPPLLSKSQCSRLRDAMRWSRNKLKPFRAFRNDAIRQYVGKHYGENASSEKVPINLIELAVSIYTRQLAARAPKALVTSSHPDYKYSAELLELALNRTIDQIKLAASLRACVTDAMFGMGIMKVALEPVGDFTFGDEQFQAGRPYADTVHFDDFVFDAGAKKWSEVTFIGNRYRVSLEWAKSNPDFNSEARSKLTRTSKTAATLDDGSERTSEISRGSDNDPDEFEDMTELYDVFLPHKQLVVTFSADDKSEPLRIAEWNGPVNGPFHLLWFSEVPDQLLPLAPVSTWIDLHNLQNAIMRKVGDQATGQKTFLGVQAGNVEDGETAKNAKDGDVVVFNSQSPGQEYRLGGPDQANLAMVPFIRQMFSYIAGNLDSIGGLSQQSETLGGSELIEASASKRLAEMSDRVSEFVSSIVNDIGWYLFYDPMINLPLNYRVGNRTLPIRYTQDMKRGDFLAYTFEIEPYSMSHQTPGMRLQQINQLFTGYLMPLFAQLQSQGVQINWEVLMRTLAKYLNLSEIEDFLMFGDPSLTKAGSNTVGDPPSKPSVTRRESVRVSKPGVTQGSQDSALLQAIAAGQRQPAGQGQPGGM